MEKAVPGRSLLDTVCLTSLLMIWVKKYGEGELTEEIHLQEQVVEDQAKIAALERKIGQLTMELDAMKKRGIIHVT